MRRCVGTRRCLAQYGLGAWLCQRALVTPNARRRLDGRVGRGPAPPPGVSDYLFRQRPAAVWRSDGPAHDLEGCQGHLRCPTSAKVTVSPDRGGRRLSAELTMPNRLRAMDGAAAVGLESAPRSLIHALARRGEPRPTVGGTRRVSPLSHIASRHAAGVTRTACGTLRSPGPPRPPRA